LSEEPEVDPFYGWPIRYAPPILVDGRMHLGLYSMWDPEEFTPGSDFVQRRLATDDPHREVKCADGMDLAALDELLPLAPLRGLHFFDSTVSDGTWEVIRDLNPEVLMFAYCNNLASIVSAPRFELPRLKYLLLTTGDTSDRVVTECLARFGKSLEVLVLSPRPERVTDRINDALRHCTQLRELRIEYTRSSADLLWRLAELPSLEEVQILSLDDFSLDDKHRFQNLRPDLKVVWLSRSP
jgi:hypothetical protein